MHFVSHNLCKTTNANQKKYCFHFGHKSFDTAVQKFVKHYFSAQHHDRKSLKKELVLISEIGIPEFYLEYISMSCDAHEKNTYLTKPRINSFHYLINTIAKKR